MAKAVAHHTKAAFIAVVGSEFVQKYLGEGPRMVRNVLSRTINIGCILSCALLDCTGWAPLLSTPDGAIVSIVLQLLLLFVILLTIFRV
jgi:SpoVK/Ycf46/Vps4 family AAA+-type ATPase